MANHMAWRRWGQPFPAQCPFQARRQWGLYTALAHFWHVSSFVLGVSFSPSLYHLFSFLLFYPFFFLSVCFFPPLCLSVKLFLFLESDELLLPLLFLLWNTRSQPDGSSHKFQAACHRFCLGKRKRMHVWPTQQPLVLASGHAAAGKKKSCLSRAEH